MTFQRGQQVVVTAEKSEAFQRVGAVIAPPNTKWKRHSVMVGGKLYGFRANELAAWPPAAGMDEREIDREPASDPVNHPSHYTSHPSGIECIQITRHMGFNTGNAMKYLWRADLKNDAIEDLKKAAFYIQDEIKKREGAR